MPRDPNRPRGGKRERRRRTALQSAFDDGSLTQEQLEPSKSLRLAGFLAGDPTASSSVHDAGSTRLRSPSPAPEPSRCVLRARSPAPAPEPPRAVLRARSPSTSPDWSPPDHTSPVDERPPPRLRRIAIDLHGTLDGGRRNSRLPYSFKEAVRKLTNAGFVVWICSHIGLNGERSDERRQQAERARRELAKFLRLDPAAPAGPSDAGVFCRIVDRRLWSKDKGGGKAVELRKHETSILFDERP